MDTAMYCQEEAANNLKLDKGSTQTVQLVDERKTLNYNHENKRAGGHWI